MPPSADFGTIAIGDTSATISFSLSPAGGGESDDTITAITACPPAFQVQTPPLPAEVFRHCGVTQEPTNPNEEGLNPAFDQLSCPSPNIRTLPFNATFSPSAAGFQQCVGVIEMTSGSQSFTLTGTGKAEDFAINVSPRNVNFGDINEGETSSARIVTARNLGAMTLSVSAVVKGATEFQLTS